MNREMRRLMEREERRQKSKERDGGGRAARRANALARRQGEAGERTSLWRRITAFLHEVRVEMRKVSWPSREQMVAFTTVTLITTVALTLIVFGADVALKEFVLFVIGESGG